MNAEPNSIRIWSGSSSGIDVVRTNTGDVVVVSRSSPLREGNEDAALVVVRPQCTLIAVADGMGGMRNGEIASRLTLEHVGRHFEAAEGLGRELVDAVIEGLEAANDAILDGRIGGGTTFAGVVLGPDSASSIHVGDSETFHFGSDGSLKDRTVPHSPVGRELAAGRIDETSALLHSERHLLSQHVGMEHISIEESRPQERAGFDRFLVASDGLLDNLLASEIAERCCGADARTAAERLADDACARMTSPRGQLGKPDDLTFALHVPHAG